MHTSSHNRGTIPDLRWGRLCEGEESMRSVIKDEMRRGGFCPWLQERETTFTSERTNNFYDVMSSFFFYLDTTRPDGYTGGKTRVYG
jgi:hypothetical protein